MFFSSFPIIFHRFRCEQVPFLAVRSASKRVLKVEIELYKAVEASQHRVLPGQRPDPRLRLELEPRKGRVCRGFYIYLEYMQGAN